MGPTRKLRLLPLAVGGWRAGSGLDHGLLRGRPRDYSIQVRFNPYANILLKSASKQHLLTSAQSKQASSIHKLLSQMTSASKDSSGRSFMLHAGMPPGRQGTHWTPEVAPDPEQDGGLATRPRPEQHGGPALRHHLEQPGQPPPRPCPWPEHHGRAVALALAGEPAAVEVRGRSVGARRERRA